jgi:hypothetical protein
LSQTGISLGRVFLIEPPEGSPAVPGVPIVRTYQNHWSPVHLDVLVSHLESAIERCLAAGAVSCTQVRVHSFGRLAGTRDPFGHGFCLIEFNADGYAAAISG